jgi:hypothetical protein
MLYDVSEQVMNKHDEDIPIPLSISSLLFSPCVHIYISIYIYISILFKLIPFDTNLFKPIPFKL